jgi:hypothetical protein
LTGLAIYFDRFHDDLIVNPQKSTFKAKEVCIQASNQIRTGCDTPRRLKFQNNHTYETARHSGIPFRR